MPLTQIIFGVVLVLILLGVAGYGTWRQLQVLRRLREEEAASDENRHLRHQAWRRLAGSGLMVALAGLLTGALVYLEIPAQEIADQGPRVAITPAQKAFVNFYSYYWIVFLLLLLALVFLAGYDLWALRRHSIRQFRRLQAERRAMIEEETAHLRQSRVERN